MKALPYVIIAICALAIIGGAYYLGTRQAAPPIIHNTTIEADSIPANITYITQPADPDDPLQEPVDYEYAEMDTTLTSESGLTSIDLGIGYNELDNTFDLAAQITEKPPHVPFLRPYAQIGVGFNSGIREADLGAGVLLKNKYSIGGYVDTEGTIGVRVGVIF